MSGELFGRTSEGMRISVRVTPKASRDEVAGLYRASDGAVSFLVKVRAAPDKGQANSGVIETLARALGVPKSRLQIIAGQTGRNKLVLVSGDNDAIEGRISALITSLGET